MNVTKDTRRLRRRQLGDSGTADASKPTGADRPLPRGNRPRLAPGPLQLALHAQEVLHLRCRQHDDVILPPPDVTVCNPSYEVPG